MYQQISIFDILEPPQESRLTSECRKGSGFEDGRVRIYCASLNLGVKEFAGFLKDEYGVGGHSATFPDGASGFTDYNPSGFIIREWKTNQTEKHNWQEVAKEIKRMILNGEYLTEKEQEQVREICGDGPAPMPIARVNESVWRNRAKTAV